MTPERSASSWPLMSFDTSVSDAIATAARGRVSGVAVPDQGTYHVFYVPEMIGAFERNGNAVLREVEASMLTEQQFSALQGAGTLQISVPLWVCPNNDWTDVRSGKCPNDGRDLQKVVGP